MAWHMSSLPPGEGISLICSKNSFLHMYTSVSPQNIFNIVNFVGIESHIKFTFPSHFSINLQVWMPIPVYILIFLHIFCLEMLGIDSG